MNRSQHFITSKFGLYNGKSLDAYLTLGGYSGLRNSIALGKEGVIESIKQSGLRGRGGAGFPTYRKWDVAFKRQSPDQLVLCNADEGEPGTFKDRDLLDKDPYLVIEGLTIAAYVTGASQGYIYIREEYSHIHDKVRSCIKQARAQNLLGDQILGENFNFDIKVFSGAGAYICGENSSLIESMEGKAGRPRIKPPRVGDVGYQGKPTMVNNVETLATVATFMAEGVEKFIAFGTDKSPGTKLISLCGSVNNPGTYEIPFGVTLDEIINDIGGGIKDNKQVKFVQLGGASGGIMPAKMFNTPYDYESLEDAGFSVGSGAILVADEDVSVVDFLLAIGDFFYHESCGKCTPCREGKRQLTKIMKKVKSGEATAEDMMNIQKIANVMKNASFCGLGQTAPTAILKAIEHFPTELYKDVEGMFPL